MIGILALQGAFREHQKIIELLDQRTVLVKKPSQLQAIDGLIICGGESTAISLLIDKYGFKKPLKNFANHKPMFATCAGIILLAQDVKDGKTCVPVLDIVVKRNAFGRQVDSFEADLKIPALGAKPFPGIFIRAPWVEKVGKNVEVLAKIGKKIVAIREDNVIGLCFHPELTNDTRFHQYFVTMLGSRVEGRRSRV